MRYKEFIIEGRNAVLEAFRAGKTIDKLFVLDGCQDGPVKSILREAKKTDTIINFVDKERLDRLALIWRPFFFNIPLFFALPHFCHWHRLAL